MSQEQKQQLWEKAVAFHGHECPGLAIGFKACEAAVEKMNLTWPNSQDPQQVIDEEIVCITENDACGVDAIQALLSCTLGKGNLIYHNTGKQAFSFYNRQNNQKLRMYLKADNKNSMDRDQWQDKLLAAPIDEVFAFSEPQNDLPEQARLFNTTTCAKCGEGAAEHKMHLHDGEPICEDCFQSYSRGW